MNSIMGRYVRGPNGQMLPLPDEPYIWVIVEPHNDPRLCLCTWHYPSGRAKQLELSINNVEEFLRNKVWKRSEPWLDLQEGL